MICIKKILKQRIDYYTSMRGLSQTKVADMIGMRVSNYSRILNGQNWIQWETIEKLCKVFDCEPVDLFTVTVSLTPLQASEIHAEIGNVLNRHISYGWKQISHDAIVEALFSEKKTKSTY